MWSDKWVSFLQHQLQAGLCQLWNQSIIFYPLVLVADCVILYRSPYFFFGVLVIRPHALVGSACTREQLRGGHRRCAADLFPQFIAQVLLDSLFWDCFCFILFPSLFSRCWNSPSKATRPMLDSRSISLNSHNTLNKYLWPAPRSHSQLDIPTELIFGKGRSRSCKVM